MRLLLVTTTVLLSLNQPNPSLAKPSATVNPSTDADLHFCGEKLPTHLPAVAERWQRAIINRARYTEDLLEIQRKAAVLFPIIEPILVENAIPKDLKYLALVESELKSNALSRQGAAGLWQLMPQTARDLGLTVHSRKDQRYDVRAATQAACRYLWDLYRQTGSWMMAASAYNAGPNHISQLSRQFTVSHPLMLPFAKSETLAYVYQALAYKELLTRPEQYRNLLSTRIISALARNADMVSSFERESILAAIETPHSASQSRPAPAEMATASLAQAAVLVSDGTMSESLRFNDLAPAVSAVLPGAKPAPVAEPASHPWPAVRTRSLSNNPLAEGQLFVFEVISPQTVDEVPLVVGDVVYAHVEVIDRASGRVYLRADRVMSSRTQETRPIKLMAVEKSHQPGVPVPGYDALASGWQLAWEKI